MDEINPVPAIIDFLQNPDEETSPTTTLTNQLMDMSLLRVLDKASYILDIGWREI